MTPRSALIVLLAWIAPFGGTTPQVTTRDTLQVEASYSACFVQPLESKRIWVPDGDGYRCDDHWIPRHAVEDARRAALESDREPREVAAQLGWTPEFVGTRLGPLVEGLLEIGLAEKRDPATLARDINTWVLFENLTLFVEDEVQRKVSSTTRLFVRVTLPGNPPVTVTSDASERGWLLPWEVDAGDRIWTTVDVRLPKALLPLLPEDTPNRETLDGQFYWDEWVWQDVFVQSALFYRGPAVHWASHYQRIAGFDDVPPGCRVGRARPFEGDGCRAVQCDLEIPTGGSIDRVRWWNRIVDDQPVSSWTELLETIQQAKEVVGRVPWIETWRLSGPNRHVCLQVRSPMPDGGVPPWNSGAVGAWRTSGFRGEPSIELRLMRGEATAALVHLSRADRGSIATDVRPGEGDHWLDRQDVSYHPRAPTYVRVDPSGSWEFRTSLAVELEPSGSGFHPR